jgi:hypothetical protein
MKGSGNYPAANGKNILYLTSPPFNPHISGMSETDPESRLASIKTRMFNARLQRPRPLLDDKILTDWNCLFIAALAQAARTFRNDTYLTAARRAMQFVLEHMHDETGRLLHRYRAGEAAIPAFGDDYVFLIRALIELYESTFESSYLSSALEHNAWFLSHFHDTERGGFFTLSDTEKVLLVRKKEIYDGAIPSCNSIAFENLVRLYHLTADPAFERMGLELYRCFAKTVQQSPSAYTGFLCALDGAIGPVHDIVIAGDRAAPDTRAMINALWDHYLPDVVVHYMPPDDSRRTLVILAPFIRNLKAGVSTATAYVCTGGTCAMPVTDPDQMLELLGCARSRNKNKKTSPEEIP